LRYKTSQNYIVAVFITLFSFSTLAEDIWTRDKLTGDWGGMRTKLGEHGIDIGLRLSQYYQGVASGGKNENSEYGGTMDYRVNADLNKLMGTWEGLSVSMHARTRFGEDISADTGAFVLENTGLLMPAPGDYHDTDVTGLLVNQLFPVGKDHIGLLSLGKVDILDAVTLFFPRVSYGQEGFWNVNSMVTALPWFGAVEGLSLYGGWLATINKEHGIGQSAIIVTGTENVSDNWGSVSDSFDDVWVAAFHRFLWKMDDELPGYFMIFGGFSTKEQASNDPSDFILIPGQGIVNTDTDKPWDIALYLSQDVWHAEGNPKRIVTILMGGTFGPDNPQFAQFNAFGNVEAFGFMDSRPNDRMGVGVFWNGLSDNFKELTAPIIELQDFWGVELYYNFEVTKWAHLSADLQLVETEVEDNGFAVIPGVRLVIDI
jgi:porin